MTDTSWLEIDVSKLRQNAARWRDLLNQTSKASRANKPATKICGVVKADGYGLGAGEVAHHLEKAGVDMLAVYSSAQADALFKAGATRPVVVLMPVRNQPETPELFQAMVQGQLHLTVDSPDQLLMLNRLGSRVGCTVAVQLCVDTGMCRGGLAIEQFASALKSFPLLSNVRLAGIWTHFSSVVSDPSFTRKQWATFRHTLRANRKHIGSDVVCHAAATQASLEDSRYHFDMVRIGLGLIGWTPKKLTETSNALNDKNESKSRNDSKGKPSLITRLNQTLVRPCTIELKPVVRWRSRLVHVRRYPKGGRVGYDGTVVLKRDSFLGIVPVGYGDGYPISLSNKAVVQLCGKGGSGSAGSGSGSSDKSTPRYAPVIGRVNMDQIIVDLTHPTAPANHSACQIAQAQVDDVVELVGSEADAPNSLVNLAAHAGSTCYEMLCRVSHRVPRVWHDSAQSADPIALPFRDHSAA